MKDLSELVKRLQLTSSCYHEKLRLRNAIYSDTATYGHFNSSLFPWENVDFNLNLRKVAEKFLQEGDSI